ncbi:MAG: hypothetical protein EOO71_20725 [Myxococcaceae bacterium]|nr:MAG: hypothetical protein EOO71_20725 [Myxococcaceae bacterium]
MPEEKGCLRPSRPCLCAVASAVLCSIFCGGSLDLHRKGGGMSQAVFEVAEGLGKIEQELQAVEGRRKSWKDGTAGKALQAAKAVVDDVNRSVPNVGQTRFRLEVHHLQTETDSDGFEIVLAGGPGVGFERNNRNGAMEHIHEHAARLRFSQEVRGLVFVRMLDGLLGNSTPTVAWAEYYEPYMIASNEKVLTLLLKFMKRATSDHWTAKKDALPPKP